MHSVQTHRNGIPQRIAIPCSISIPISMPISSQPYENRRHASAIWATTKIEEFFNEIVEMMTT